MLLLPFSFSSEAETTEEAATGGAGGSGGGAGSISGCCGCAGSPSGGGFSTVSLAGFSRKRSLAAAVREALISEVGTLAARTRAPGGSRPKSRPCLCLAQRARLFFCTFCIFAEASVGGGGGGGGGGGAAGPAAAAAENDDDEGGGSGGFAGAPAPLQGRSPALASRMEPLGLQVCERSR